LLTEIIPKSTFQRYSFSRLSFLSNSADVKSKKWWANEVWRLPYLLLFPHFLRFLGPDHRQLLHESEPLHLLVRFQTKPRLLCTIRKGTKLTKKFGYMPVLINLITAETLILTRNSFPLQARRVFVV
jgi:hypothetical protein